MTTKSDKSEAASVGKALQVLEYLAALEGDISLKDLCAAMGMPKTTLLRLLTTLRGHNVVSQDPVTKNYRLGWALIYMGAAASRSFNISTVVRPYLDRLSKESGESASLVQFQRESAVYVDQVSANNLIRGGLGVGAQLQIHVSAGGKILICDWTDEQIREFLQRNPLETRTSKTITDPDAFIREIHRVRERGYALDDEEGEIGGRCIGAPIRDWSQKIVAAFSITGPSSRINAHTLPRLVGIVTAAARDASAALGASATNGGLSYPQPND